MMQNILIIDNDIRYVNILKHKLKDHLDLQCKSVNNFNALDKIEELEKFDLYFIRLHPSTIPLMDRLSDDDKLIIALTNKYDDKTRERILSLGVSDYIITDNNSHGDIAIYLVQRLMNNAQLTVLLVDDSSLILNTLSILLDTQNLNYVRSKNGQEAWDYLNNPESKTIDLVISDYEMPHMDGYELTKRIRSKYDKNTLPVLILSGTEENSMIAKFLKVGVNDYIPKPFINEEFINRVSNTLSTFEMFKKLKNN